MTALSLWLKLLATIIESYAPTLKTWNDIKTKINGIFSRFIHARNTGFFKYKLKEIEAIKIEY